MFWICGALAAVAVLAVLAGTRTVDAVRQEADAPAPADASTPADGEPVKEGAAVDGSVP